MSNILIISDETKTIDLIKSKISMRRICDKPSFCSFKDAKKILSNKDFAIVIIEENPDALEKIISYTKNSAAEILIFCNSDNKYYNLNIFDCINENTTSDELKNKLLNCTKLVNYKKLITENKTYFENTGVLNTKNECFKLKYLKEIFNEIPGKNECTLVVITLDDSVKTKVSTNRLAGIIKKSIRFNDIFAEGEKGIFYLLFENMTLQNAQIFIDNIQNKIGEELIIRAGINQISFQNFEDAAKNALDSLQKAIKNNKTSEAITENNQDEWLDTEYPNKNKQFKLFNKVYENKLKNIIEPTFYRFKKECDSKFNINQYVNKIESAFSFKQENSHSELILRYDGFTKINIEISHNGLYSCDNSKFDIPLNKFNEKELTRILKRLKQEFIKSKS